MSVKSSKGQVWWQYSHSNANRCPIQTPWYTQIHTQKPPSSAMHPQRFHIKIDLKLHAVTCPGVWLCSHGYLEVTIKTLGYFFRTGAIEPYFPLLCHDLYKMEGYFKNANSIATLISNLQSETLEITLWQSGRRLAYYQGVIMDLLHITEPKLHCPHVDNRVLLVKTTPAFPGIIAPKVELSAEFYIKDKVLNLSNINDELKTTFPNVPRKTLGFLSTSKQLKNVAEVKFPSYQRPCIINPDHYDDSASINGPRKQRAVCHARDFPHTSVKPIQSVYKSNSRRVSLVSTCSSNNTQISADMYDLAHDRAADLVPLHHSGGGDCCDLCRLYKDVFLK